MTTRIANHLVYITSYFISLIARIILPRTELELFFYKLSTFRLESQIFSNRLSAGIIHNALIIGEDHRYYSHIGCDIIAIIRAIKKIIFNGKIEGGSTIEQQLVRVITSRYERTIRRKIKEILFASQIHRVCNKREIIDIYISIAYFGHQMNGIKQACDKLKLDINNIKISDAIALIARLKYPQPKIHSKRWKIKFLSRVSHIYMLTQQGTSHVKCKPIRDIGSSQLNFESISNAR